MKDFEKIVAEINKVLKDNNCHLEVSEWLSIYDKDSDNWKELDSIDGELSIINKLNPNW